MMIPKYFARDHNAPKITRTRVYGEKGKKYMRGKMRKFVVSLSDENMNHQLKSFAKEFDQWKGDFDQVDDICVIGVEV